MKGIKSAKDTFEIAFLIFAMASLTTSVDSGDSAQTSTLDSEGTSATGL